MNALVTTTNNTRFPVDTYVLHDSLEVKTEYSKWMTRRIAEYGFIENSDYEEVFVKSGDNPHASETQVDVGGRPSRRIYCTISMAKEFCMLENNDRDNRV